MPAKRLPNPPKGTQRPAPTTKAERAAAVKKATNPPKKAVRKPRSDKGKPRTGGGRRPTPEQIAAKKEEGAGNVRVRTPATPRMELTPAEQELYNVVKNPDGTYRIARKKGANTLNVTDPIPTTPANRMREGPICGAPRTGRSTQGPGVCCQPAGHGTVHVGYGRCSKHGGNSPTHNAAAAKAIVTEMFTSTYGEPIDITPQEALLSEVQRTAGHVQWLGDFIKVMTDGLPGTNFTADQLDAMTVEQFEELTTGAGPNWLVQFSEKGISPSVWITMYQEERKHYVKVSKMAIDAGVAERQIELAEQQAMIMATLIRKFVMDPRMEMTPQQMVNYKTVIRELLDEARTLPQLAAPIEGELSVEANPHDV